MTDTQKQNNLICIVGPTAIGKTKLAINLANFFSTEIISADSRQFYKEMSIGTAKPSEEELSQAKHHFIDFLSIHDTYNAGLFEKEASTLLSTLFEKHSSVILVGGSGMYVKALIDGLDSFPEIPSSVRQELTTELALKGKEALYAQLKELDPLTALEIDSSNPQRIIRALEVCIASGKPYSSFKAKKSAKNTYNTVVIGLTQERAELYTRINTRVDAMVASGLLEEVKNLEQHKLLNALQTVGYSELFDYLIAKISFTEAVNKIKQHTRNYAKRQLTWFKKQADIEWFNPNDEQKIKEYIISKLS